MVVYGRWLLLASSHLEDSPTQSCGNVLFDSLGNMTGCLTVTQIMASQPWT